MKNRKYFSFIPLLSRGIKMKNISKITAGLLAISLISGCSHNETTTNKFSPVGWHHRGGPTPQPSNEPSAMPSTVPSAMPSAVPTVKPSAVPTVKPLVSPVPTVKPSVAPTMAPTSVPVSSEWSAPNNYPPATWQPFGASGSSIWNSPFTAPGFAAVVASNNSTLMSFYGNSYSWFTQMGFGYTSSNEANSWNPPIYFGYSTDPSYTLNCTQSWFSCPSGPVHIPKYAQPEDTSDGHIGIIDYTYSPAKEFDAWSASKLSGNGGTATAQVWGSGPINGNGLNLNAVAGGYGLTAGNIRASELIAGNIPHALFIVAPCTANSSVYPSIVRATDTQCSGSNGVNYGQRFRLNMTQAQLLALGLPSYEYAIGMALINYGGYVGDTNGGSGWEIETENDYTYTLAGYTNSACPNNGSACTPLSAWFNTNYPSAWNGSNYNISLSGINFQTYGQWLNPPTTQP